MNKGKFITFEGIDAAGKTTQIDLLRKKYESDPRFVFVKEPGGTVLGEKIRNLLLNDESFQMQPKAELLLFIASRVELYEKVIRPSLDAGKIVVADRYYDSTCAYQGAGRNILGQDEILKINRFFIDGLTPDLTFYFKLSPNEAAKRKGDSHLDKLEQEGLAFQKKVAAGYDKLISTEPDRFYIVNAAQSVEAIEKEVENKLKSLCNI